MPFAHEGRDLEVPGDEPGQLCIAAFGLGATLAQLDHHAVFATQLGSAEAQRHTSTAPGIIRK